MEGTSGLDRHQFETKQPEISLLIASSKEIPHSRGDQTTYKSIAVNCLVERGRSLISINIYLSPQYDQQLFF
jgi:hypothetical protein